MTRLPEKIWRCDCGAEALGVSFYSWPDSTPTEWFIEVYKLGGVGHWRWRMRKAFAMLLGRDVYIDAVSLDRHKVAELLDFLNASIAEASKPTPSPITATTNSSTSFTFTGVAEPEGT
jgi:hypothetical protein